MKRKLLSILLVTAILCGLFAGCRKTEPTPEPAVEDHDGISELEKGCYALVDKHGDRAGFFLSTGKKLTVFGENGAVLLEEARFSFEEEDAAFTVNGKEAFSLTEEDDELLAVIPKNSPTGLPKGTYTLEDVRQSAIPQLQTEPSPAGTEVPAAPVVPSVPDTPETPEPPIDPEDWTYPRDGFLEPVVFSEITYTRPDLEKLREDCDVLIGYLEELSPGEDYDTLTGRLDGWFRQWSDFYTMDTFAMLATDRDTTDSYFAEEYAYLLEQETDVDDMYDSVLIACAQSPFDYELEDYFWEGYVEEYVEGDTWNTDDGFKELSDRENAVKTEYQAAIDGATLTFKGQTRLAAEWLNDESVGYRDILSLYNQYYTTYAPIFGGYYIELVKIRNQIAEYCGYDNYADYAFAEFFERDYTPEQAQELCDAIRSTLVPISKELDDSGKSYSFSDTKPLTQEELYRAVGSVMEEFGGDIAEAWRFMLKYELCDTDYSIYKQDTSYETYLNTYDYPYVLMNAANDTSDLFTLSHEFGHFVDAYVNYGGSYALETNETFSQGMELLFLNSGAGSASASELRMLINYELYNALSTFTQQAGFHEFEARVYRLPEEELTVENIGKISLECAKEYNYYLDAGLDDYFSYIWIDLFHFIEYPFYCISYVVSVETALQIYQADLATPGSGLDIYYNLLYSPYDDYLEAVENTEGMEDPFTEQAMAKTAEMFRKVFHIG